MKFKTVHDAMKWASQVYKLNNNGEYRAPPSDEGGFFCAKLAAEVWMAAASADKDATMVLRAMYEVGDDMESLIDNIADTLVAPTAWSRRTPDSKRKVIVADAVEMLRGDAQLSLERLKENLRNRDNKHRHRNVLAERIMKALYKARERISAFGVVDFETQILP